MAELEVFSRLSIPLIVAPMTQVSTPQLVAAACRAGAIGAFPATNCQSAGEFGDWLDEILETSGYGEVDAAVALPAVNLIVHRSNALLEQQLAQMAPDRVSLVITSVGNPAPVIGPVHEAGLPVFADVASVMHARKAIDAGADGLVLLAAGAGGHTGWANPFAFVRAVRAFFDGPLVLAGGVSDGAALWAAVTAGYDLGYMGTKLIATPESGASPAWREAVVSASLDEIKLGVSPVGIPASMLRDVGSAGHSISGVDGQMTTAEVIRRTAREWHQARRDSWNRLAHELRYEDEAAPQSAHYDGAQNR
jgi:nitronate monooxygenase